MNSIGCFSDAPSATAFYSLAVAPFFLGLPLIIKTDMSVSSLVDGSSALQVPSAFPHLCGHRAIL
jgi:hypothetical protein